MLYNEKERETLRQHEASGTTGETAYKQAERVFDLRHVCRVDPWPEYLNRALERMPVGKVNLK